MARMFYSAQEAQDKLGVDLNGLRGMIASGQLQEFRDRDRIMLKREQVDLLAGLGGDDDNGISIFDTSDRDDLRRPNSNSDLYGRGGPSDDATIALALENAEAEGLFEPIPKPENARDFGSLDESGRRPDIPADPEESRQTISTDDGLFLLQEIDRALATAAILDRPRVKALVATIDEGFIRPSQSTLDGDAGIANAFIGSLRLREWEQLREDLRDPETRAGLTGEIASKRLGHARDLTLQSISRTDRPTVRDVEGIMRDLSILRGIHFVAAYDKVFSQPQSLDIDCGSELVMVDLATGRAMMKAQGIARSMVERISRKGQLS